jgi:hypothetical protein
MQAEALDFGTFVAKLAPPQSGEYALHVHVTSPAGRSAIPGSPFALSVVGAHAPACSPFVLEVCPRGSAALSVEARAASVNQFRVGLFTRDLEPVDDEGGGNCLAISLEYVDGPAKGVVLDFAVDDGQGTQMKALGTRGWWKREEQGVVKLMYRPHTIGRALMHITVGAVPIAQSPVAISIVAGKPDRSRCKVQGEGLVRASCGRLATFTILAIDAMDLQIPAGGACFTAAISPLGSERSDVVVNVRDNKDGTYTCTYMVNIWGEYSLMVFLEAKPLPAMPSTVQVPGPDLRNFRLSGQGLSEALPMEEATFDIQTADSSGEMLLVGGCQFTGVLQLDGSETDVQFTDRNNGTYRAAYTPTRFGDHSLLVSARVHVHAHATLTIAPRRTQSTHT